MPFGDSCYSFHANAKTFHEAQELCHKHDKVLATGCWLGCDDNDNDDQVLVEIESQEENDMISELLFQSSLTATSMDQVGSPLNSAHNNHPCTSAGVDWRRGQLHRSEERLVLALGHRQGHGLQELLEGVDWRGQDRPLSAAQLPGEGYPELLPDIFMFRGFIAKLKGVPTVPSHEK